MTAPGFYRTEGYYPAELSEGLYSTKSDVYSYGVVSNLVCDNLKYFTRFVCVNLVGSS